jgi:uncharacterized protein (TIGR02001 family)
MKIQTILATSVVAVSLLASSAAFAGSYTGNVAVNSNYIWRGQTQSNDLAAISGGVDWSHPSGAYIGGWTSSLGGGEYEFDLYGGYGFTASKSVDLDIGFINYRYPVNSTDFAEIYINATIQNWTAGLAYTVSKDGTNQENDIYIYGTGEFEMKKDLNLVVTLGSYNFDDSQYDDYLHLQVALTKGDFIFAIDKNDDSSTAAGASKTNDEMRLTVGYSKSLDF